MILEFITLMFVTLVSGQSQSTDYCNKELCVKYTAGGGSYSTKHIGCNNDGDFKYTCPRERRLIPMTKDLVNLILHLHNGYRSDVATGKIEGYEKANQMIELSWNSELAYLAELNVKTCIFGHDDCRSTARYKRPGQNLGVTKSRPEYKDAITIVHNHTGEWFIEYAKCDMSYIREYRTSIHLIGHFTQLVKGGADRVGCAMAQYDAGRKTVLFACNYSLGNILKKPIYTTGTPCSKCKSGCSKNYAGLCNTDEKSHWTADEIKQEIQATKVSRF